MSWFPEDPYAQEERRQAEADKYIESLPECCVCETPIHPGRMNYRICIGKIEAVFCEDCFDRLADSGEILILEEETA